MGDYTVCACAGPGVGAGARVCAGYIQWDTGSIAWHGGVIAQLIATFRKKRLVFWWLVDDTYCMERDDTH